ncbi:MAG: hypothetical protein AB7V36_11710 [Bacteroidales bacterium]
MFKWKKLGRVFNPTEITNRPWLKAFAQGPSVVVFDDFIRVYFSCRPNPDENGNYVSYSAFVDLKRDNLFDILCVSKDPILSLGEKGTFDEHGTYPVSVIRDGETFVAYYGGWSRCSSVPFNVAIGLAWSTDYGVSFKKAGKGPVLSYSINEPFILSGPKIRRFNNQWHLFYIAGRKWIIHKNRPEPIYKIRMATSKDGINWDKYDKDLIPDKIGEDEAQASPDVFFYNGVYHMFFCYRGGTDYRGKENGYRIGYACSADLKSWQRDDSKAGIDVSDDGWDSEMISYPHVFELDRKIYMLYLGNQVGKYGFGLAVLENINDINTIVL